MCGGTRPSFQIRLGGYDDAKTERIKLGATPGKPTKFFYLSKPEPEVL